jgi:predicted DNA-binding transcriptional regulator YafY
MKALIEEYASHTQYQREAFYFNEWISYAEAAAAAGKLLRITTQNPKGEETSWDLRVYGILPNEAGIFHYLVGRCVLKGGLKSEENIASFRLSRLVDVRILSSSGIRSGSLSSSEKKEIEEKIAHGRVQFLIGEKQECVVRLTQKGKQMYKAIQYMKPLPSEIDEEGNYHFECSTYQILQYFYRFGGQAQVLQPQSLRELLREEYRKAYEAYEGESPESDNE